MLRNDFWYSRGSFLNSGDKIFERQHDFFAHILKIKCFLDHTNCACCSDHCKRNVFWFHEIVEKTKCAQNVHQKHIYACLTSRQFTKSSCGDSKTNDFWKPQLKPSPDNELSMLSFYGCLKMCLWWTSRAHLRFSMKSTKIKYVIQTLTRTIFPTFSHTCNAQTCSVA